VSSWGTKAGTEEQKLKCADDDEGSSSWGRMGVLRLDPGLEGISPICQKMVASQDASRQAPRQVLEYYCVSTLRHDFVTHTKQCARTVRFTVLFLTHLHHGLTVIFLTEAHYECASLLDVSCTRAQ
jgi:hypothetical protein